MSENYGSRIEKREIAKKRKKNPSNNTGTKKQKNSFWKKFLSICLIVGSVMFIVGAGSFWWIVRDAPDLDETLLSPPESSQLIANDGETVIAEVGAERRYNVTLDQIPQTLIDAVLATEDVNFYDHFGIDIPRTVMAVWSNIFHSNSITQGGSTITQQVSRNAFLTNEQTITRKVQEWYLAIQLERKFTKDEILEMYFNKNLYGGNIYGVGKAAERFFGLGVDELDQLTLEQAALLAGIPQSPNRFNPSIEDNRERAQNRRNIVLQLMNRHGYISEETMKESQSVPIEETLNIQTPPNGRFQAFVDVAITEAQEKTGANIFEDGLKIHTTLDPNIQQITEDVISSNDYIDFPANENLETGVVILDTQTGAIQAIGGGRNYQAGGFNYATMISRQPGSAAKPLLSFGPAINKLQWSTGHLLVDEEFRYSDGQIVGNQTTGRYAGVQTMRYHLKRSTNVPALKANQEVGAEYAVAFARSIGLPIADEDANNESNPLGTMSTASPLNMAGAYAAFGNGGYYIEPFTVSRIVYSDGTERDVTPESERVMEDYTAYMVTDMLRDAVQLGTGTRANITGIDVAGKTGTTSFDASAIEQFGLPNNAARDAWFVGYTPQYTAAVWTGYSRTTSSEDFLTTEQRRFSQLIFREIMSRAATSTERFERPDSVEERNGELFVVGSNPTVTTTTATPSEPITTPDSITEIDDSYTDEDYDIADDSDIIDDDDTADDSDIIDDGDIADDSDIVDDGNTTDNSDNVGDGNITDNSDNIGDSNITDNTGDGNITNDSNTTDDGPTTDNSNTIDDGSNTGDNVISEHDGNAEN